jgi:protein TonB
MLNILLESKSTKPRNRAAAIISAGLHIGLIGAALYATASGATAEREPVDPPAIHWIPAPRPADAPSHSANHSRLSVSVPRVPAIRLDIPSAIPPIGIALQPIEPSDFSTRATGANGNHLPLDSSGASEGRRAYVASEVESPASATATIRPEYPAALRSLGIEGEVIAEFVVNEGGRADSNSLRIVSSTNEAFADAVKRSLPRMRFHAAKLGGRAVPQLVQQLFVFRLNR